MKKHNTTIKIYELPKDFYAEVRREKGITHFYMCHKRHVAKEHMFGIPNCKESMEEIFLLNHVPEHVLIYAKAHCDPAFAQELEDEMIEVPEEDRGVIIF